MIGSRLSASAIQSLLRAQVADETAPEHANGPPPFTVAVSREAGALGSTVAAEVGRRLNWPVYDKELLGPIAEKAGATPFDLEGLDERTMGWLEEVTTNLVRSSHVSPYGYLKHLIGTVRALGAQGHCLIVGRGASWVLPPETTLRVRLVAAMPDRVRAVAERQHLSPRNAEVWITQTDAERARFVKKNFGADPADPHQYDLVLNTSRLSVADCTEAILGTLHRLEAAAGKRAGRAAGVAQP
jgi:cytidylate kinase